MKKYAEQIAAFEAKRKALLAANDSIMEKAADEGATLDAAQKEEFDNNEADIAEIDDHLKRLRALEKAAGEAATPVARVEKEADGSERRAGIVVKAQPKLKPGIAFARIAKVKALAKLDGESPRHLAKELYGEDSTTYGHFVKAAVPAGTSAHSTWAGALVGDETSAFADFVEFLRPLTILGKFGTNGIPSLRAVPFRVPLVGQTSGGQGYWVGEGKPKPLTKFDFARKTLEPAKVANIAVCSVELLRDSSPSAETLVRDSLVAALRERLDIDFGDPSKAAVATVSPASVTYGVTPIPSSGNDADAVREDIRSIFGAFIAANNAPTSGVWLMPTTVALALSLMRNPLGQKEFPDITMLGGTLEGLPVIVSEYVPTVSAGAYVILVNAQDVYLADDGGVSVDMSREASLQMDDAPATQDAGAGTGTSLVSLWQTNSVGFLAERTINWEKRRAEAVQVLSGVNWGLPSGTG